MPDNTAPLMMQAFSEITSYETPTLQATYNPATGTYTIGYMGLFEAITPGETWTNATAAYRLQSEIQNAHSVLSAGIDGFDLMNTTQQASIIHAALASGGPLSFITNNEALVAAIGDADYAAAGDLLASAMEGTLGAARADALAEAVATGEQGAALPPLTADQANSDLSRTANIEPDNSATMEEAVGSMPDMGFPIPIDASPSGAVKALWTNRVPQHEPWPRVLKCHPMKDPDATQEYEDATGMAYENIEVSQRQDLNRHHKNELSDDSAWVGRVEGDELIERGPLWKR